MLEKQLQECTYAYIVWHRQVLWPIAWQTKPQLSLLQPNFCHGSWRGTRSRL